jgi:hypothetical protein
VIDSNAQAGITVNEPGATNTLIQTNLIGQGVNGEALGNGSFGILILNGAPMPTIVGNTNVNNALGPIRNTTVAPSSSTVATSTTKHSTKVTTSKTKNVVVQKAKAKTTVKIQAKASSFQSRPMPKLQHPSKPSSTKK